SSSLCVSPRLPLSNPFPCATLFRSASDGPVHRRLRVLEIADGPSEVPRAVLAALPEDRLDYVLALPETVAERQRAEYAHAPNLRSEEHTSELQSRENLVCRLLLEKK